jgi:hypothetical protein
VRECTLFSADGRTSQLVSTAGAALGLRITHENQLPEYFPEQGLLLIATDLSPTSMPTRPGVLLLDLEIDALSSTGALVGMAGDDQQVITNLVNRIASCSGGDPTSQLVSITSPAGGLGLTTLIALLGLISTRSNRSTLLVEHSTQLLRILGAKGVATNHELNAPELKKVGVLSADVVVTPALLLDARARFDSVIFGVLDSGAELVNASCSLHLTANTALAVEQSASVLTTSRIDSARILVRQMSFGTLSTQQVATTLRKRNVAEWPDDSDLSLAADFGDLYKAKRAIHRAEGIWLNLVGGHVDR